MADFVQNFILTVGAGVTVRYIRKRLDRLGRGR